jgi:hypothetical protein
MTHTVPTAPRTSHPIYIYASIIHPCIWLIITVLKNQFLRSSYRARFFGLKKKLAVCQSLFLNFQTLSFGAQ